MIFKPEMVAAILERRKFETRRPAKGEACRYRAGVEYAVQPGRGKPGVARIVVWDVGLELLGEITDRGAVLEGFADRDAFLTYWRALYGTVDESQHVHVIRFALAET